MSVLEAIRNFDLHSFIKENHEDDDQSVTSTVEFWCQYDEECVELEISCYVNYQYYEGCREYDSSYTLEFDSGLDMELIDNNSDVSDHQIKLVLGEIENKFNNR